MSRSNILKFAQPAVCNTFAQVCTHGRTVLVPSVEQPENSQIKRRYFPSVRPYQFMVVLVTNTKINISTFIPCSIVLHFGAGARPFRDMPLYLKAVALYASVAARGRSA